MTFGEFQRLIDSATVPPIVVFHGDEPYLARLGVELLKRRVLKPGSEAFDFTSLVGRETSAEAIVSSATTAPMLSERRLTVVYEFERMNPSHKTKLLEYLKRPSDAACLALVGHENLSDKRSRFNDAVLAVPCVVECAPPRGDVLVSLVRRMAEERGAAIDDDALSVLVAWTDGKLTRIANELDKLVCLAGETETIALSHVEAAVGMKASGILDLAVAVAEGDAGEALRVLKELTDGGVAEAQLVSQLFGVWIGLWRARLRDHRRYRRGAIWSPELARLAGERTSREYAEGVARFYEADTAIRRGVAPGPVVGILVFELAGAS